MTHSPDHGRDTVRVPVSRTRLVLTLVGSLALGVCLVLLLTVMVGQSARQGHLPAALAHPVVWCTAIAIIACLVLVPVAVVARLRRRESLVVTRDHLVEEWQGTIRAATPWTDIADVTTERVGALKLNPGRLVVTYTLTSAGRERVERQCAAAGARPPWISPARPGVVMLVSGHVLRPRQLAELLGAAHRRAVSPS